MIFLRSKNSRRGSRKKDSACRWEEGPSVSGRKEEERTEMAPMGLTASALAASEGCLAEKTLGLGREERPIPIQSRMKARRPVSAAVSEEEGKGKSQPSRSSAASVSCSTFPFVFPTSPPVSHASLANEKLTHLSSQRYRSSSKRSQLRDRIRVAADWLLPPRRGLPRREP